MAGVLDDFMAQLKQKGSDFMTGVDHLNPASNLTRASEALSTANAKAPPSPADVEAKRLADQQASIRAYLASQPAKK